MNDKKIKNGGKGTNVGNALRWLAKSGKKIAPELLDLVGDVTGVGALNKISDLINKEKELSEEDKQFLMKQIELDYIDVSNARDLQKTALNQEDLFSKRFVYYLSIGLFSFSCIVVLLLFFVEVPEQNKDVVNFILGIVVGTGLTGMFQYFFGSTKGSKDKTNLLFSKK